MCFENELGVACFCDFIRWNPFSKDKALDRQCEAKPLCKGFKVHEKQELEFYQHLGLYKTFKKGVKS